MTNDAPQDPWQATVRVIWEAPDGRHEAVFHGRVRIGRSVDCTLVFAVPTVSKQHAEIYPKDGRWWVRDLGSRNGTFVNGHRIEQQAVADHSCLRLGLEGPTLDLTVIGEECEGADDALATAVQPSSSLHSSSSRCTDRVVGFPIKVSAGQSTSRSEPPDNVEDIAARYFGTDDNVGDHTWRIRQAFRQEQEKQLEERLRQQRVLQNRRYVGALVALVALVLSSLGVLYSWSQKEETARQYAIELFYDIKEMQLRLAELEKKAVGTGELERMLAKERKAYAQMRARYQEFLEQSRALGPYATEVDRLIYHVAQVFGECELTMPEGFQETVKVYIKRWQSSDRLASAIRRAERNGYISTIQQALAMQDLPPQFLYVALQESDFDERAIGPLTASNKIAKGLWQFIGETAEEYNLHVGPLRDKRLYDPDDQRFDIKAATHAAARYLRHLYTTDAQASGLLVIASYNWGPGNVQQLIRRMPKNPRERNFWALIQQYDIPDETYEYVFYIFSAAVIGENPALFGFDFENPLNAARQTLARFCQSRPGSRCSAA
jgi:soluble lytic murein transglycosylase-like protein